MNSRSLLRSFVRGGHCVRPFVAPFAFYHAARIAGDSFEALLYDPTRLTRALLDQQRLLGLDAVAVKLDETVIGAAGGLQVDWAAPIPRLDADEADLEALWPRARDLADGLATVFDVVGRLAAELRREVPVLVVIPSPRSLLGADGKAVAEVQALLRDIVDRSCKAGAEAVAIDAALGDWDEEAVRADLAPIINTARYYNAATFVTVRQPTAAKLADAIILPPDAPLPPRGMRVGMTIPTACFGAEDATEQFAAMLQDQGGPHFVTADDRVLVDQPIERIVAVVSRLRAIAL